MRESVLFVCLSNKCIANPFPTDTRPPYNLIQTSEILKVKYNIPSLMVDGQVQQLKASELARRCLAFKPRIVVLSCLSTKIDECRDFLKIIKENDPEIVCIAVGHLATYCTKRICNPSSHVDFVIRGEFQFVLADFIRGLLFPGMIDLPVPEGFVFSKDSAKLSLLHIINNVDALPVVSPSRGFFKQYKNIIPVPLAKHILWGRLFSSYGCPNSCIFCSQAIRDTYGQNYRPRSIPYIIDEMKYLRSAGANVIEFCDDNFTASKDHLIALCRSIIQNKIDLPWGAHARIDDLTYEILLLMKQSGCIFIRCGIESGSTRIINSIKKSDSMISWRQQARKVFGWSKELDIMTIANFILGSPGETEADIQETEELIRDLNPELIQLHSFCPYPGSSAYAVLPEEPSDQELVRMYHCNQFNFSDRPQLFRDKQREILINFYFRPSYIVKHLFKFGLYYLFNCEKTVFLIRPLFKMMRLLKSDA